ncbi:MAG: tetratricopeptide repeat protein, partial [bacterium]
MGKSSRRKTPTTTADGAPPSRPTAAPARQRSGPRGALLRWVPPSPDLETWLGARWVLAAILGLGLALRLVHLGALAGSPFFDSLVLDARYYDTWARQIAAGAWVGTAAFWVDPLYAYVLGAIYAVAGHNLLWTRVLNLVCGLATALLTADIAYRVWRSRAAAALAAFGAVTFVPAYYFEGQSEKTAVTVVLVTAAVALFLRGTRRAILAAGIVTGLAALARGNALLFAPFAAVCLLLGWEREEDQAAAPPRQRLTRAALFLAGMLPIVGLATLHNWLAVHELVPTTTNLGVNLYLGNHAGNQYGFYSPPDFLHPDTGAELPDFHAEAERRTGRVMSDAELSNYWRDQAWAESIAHPGLALSRTFSKLYLTLNDTEIPDNEDVAMVAQWSPVLKSPILWMGELLPFALLGAVIGWRRRAVRLVLGVTAIYVASLLPFFVMARLRIQIVPLLCVLAGGAVVWLVTVARQRRTRALLAAAALLVPLFVLARYQTAEVARRRASGLAIAWNNLGSSFLKAQQPQQAIAAYEHAIAIDVGSVPASLRSLADVYRQQGDLPRAEATLRQLVELRPQSNSARVALRQLYDTMLADPRWRDDTALRARAQRADASAPAAASIAPTASPSDSPMARARALGKAGRTDEAIRVMQAAVRSGPYDENLHYMLGETMVKHATPEELVRFFSAEVGHDEKPQTSHYYWAVGLARGGDVPGAIAQLQQALEIDPAHEVSQRQWGLLLEQQGQPDAALEHFLEATRIHPDYKLAWEDAARLAAAQGHTAEAETYRQRAAAADPNSDRRYLHWARYLHEHQRDRAAWVELQHLLDAHPTDADGLALREQIRPNLDAATLAALAAPTAAAARPAAPVAAASVNSAV